MTNQRFNPDLVRAAINVLAESEPHLAAEVESLLAASTGLKPSLLPDASQPANPRDIDDMIFVPNAEVRQALIAALFYWRQMGMCEPSNRSDGIHALATGNDEFTSASEEDIDHYLLRLYAEHDPVEHLRNLRDNLECYDQVVIKSGGGLYPDVFATSKIEVSFIDFDCVEAPGLTDQHVVMIDGSKYFPRTVDFDSGEFFIDHAFCARVKQALTAFYS